MNYGQRRIVLEQNVHECCRDFQHTALRATEARFLASVQCCIEAIPTAFSGAVVFVGLD